MKTLPNGKLNPSFVKKRKKIRKIWIMETLSKDADFKPLSNPTVDKYILLKIYAITRANTELHPGVPGVWISDV